MLNFFNQNTTLPAQDVEMGIINVTEPSTHTTSLPVLPIQQNEEIALDPKNMTEIFAFINTQKKTIETCIEQVVLMRIEDTA